ncbi:NlpC/P60 family protein [Thalassobacillus sp. CUG 92003]|uniref:NlpC/P60 family protein n=1 Tax=Thalassobacillus sp. CUG 92003 TaxID=2736641 RepID=UPI0015E6307E|nr:NlpC/P60 family protein [Thalassobacillus sp. CUG 92003]
MSTHTHGRRLIWGIILAVILLVPLQSVKADKAHFPDVPEENFYYNPIQALADEQIVNGYDDGEFKIKAKITRAEAAVMIARLMELETDQVPEAPFIDVSQERWYADAVNALYQEGIVEGMGNNVFGTDQTITRAALSAMLVRGYDLQLKEEVSLPFTDVEKGAWYIDDLKVLYSHDLISGMTATTFAPETPMKRGDFALLSYNTERAHGDLFLEIADAEAISAYHLTANFTDGASLTFNLDEPLTEGENTRSIMYKGKTYSATVNFARDIPSDIASDHDLVAGALHYLGVPYIFGEETPHGFDCSGLTQYVFNEVRDIYLPRSTDQQWQVGETVGLENIQPGDVVFFSDTYRDGISHNGIYAGDGQFVHASRSQGVTVSHLDSSYWQEKFTGVKRFDGLQLSKENPIVSEAAQFIGNVPYESGGKTPEGFGASEFIQYVYEEAKGIELPRHGDEQWEVGEEISREDLEPGDIVFLKAEYLNPAIYAGDDQVIHVTVSQGVTVTNLETSTFWGPKYYGAKRVDK